jgi:hypothetical protein
VGGINEAKFCCGHRHEHRLFLFFPGTLAGLLFLSEKTEREEGLAMVGIIVPALIFLVSFVVTYLLYRHFTRHH